MLTFFVPYFMSDAFVSCMLALSAAALAVISAVVGMLVKKKRQQTI